MTPGGTAEKGGAALHTAAQASQSCRMATRLTAASVSTVAAEAMTRLAVRDSKPGVRYILTFVAVLLTGAAVVVAMPEGAHHGLLQFLLPPVVLLALAFGLSAGLLAVAVASVAGWAYLVVAVADPLSDGRLVAEAVLAVLLGVTAVVLVAAMRNSLRDRVARGPIATRPLAQFGPDPLTPREIEVLQLAASGLSVRELAALLSVSPNTVKSHLEHAYDKLGAHNRAQAVAAGLGAGCFNESAVVAASAIGSNAMNGSRSPSSSGRSETRAPARPVPRWPPAGGGPHATFGSLTSSGLGRSWPSAQELAAHRAQPARGRR